MFKVYKKVNKKSKKILLTLYYFAIKLMYKIYYPSFDINILRIITFHISIAILSFE